MAFLGNLIKKGRSMVSDAWNLGAGEYKRLTNKKALTAFAATGYMIGCSDYDPTEHTLLEDAYDADERESTLNLIETNPSTEMFDENDIREAYNAAEKFYTPPVAKMPGKAVKAKGDAAVLKLLGEFSGTDQADPLFEAACMLTWGDGKIEQGEVDALDAVGKALGLTSTQIEAGKQKFAIEVTG